MVVTYIKFLAQNILSIYLLYGLSFFILGFAILLKTRHNNRITLVKALPWLSAFGIVYGTKEWLEVLELIYPKLETVLFFNIFAFIMFSISVYFLFLFGILLIYYHKNNKKIFLLNFILIIWLALILATLTSNQSFLAYLLEFRNITRYLIYMPGSLIAGIALIVEYNSLKKQKNEVAKYFLYAGLAFFLNIIFSGIVANENLYFPSNTINTATFLAATGVPVQFFRGLTAAFIAFFLIRGLDIFYFEEQQHKNIAATLQNSLLPSEIPSIEDYSIGIYYNSATAEATIGGDFYDFIKRPDNSLIIIVGDVSGRGINAASDTANIKSLLRFFNLSEYSNNQIITELNNALFHEYNASKYFSTILISYNFEEQKFQFINAGHPQPLIYNKKENSLYFSAKSNIVLGVTENAKFFSAEIDAKDADLIVLYTDGLLEARNKGRLFGENRIKNNVAKNINLTAQEIADNLSKEAINFSENLLYDDVLIIVLKKS